MTSSRIDPVQALPALELKQGLQDVLSGTVRSTLEATTLPIYLPARRWFAGKGKTIDGVRIDYSVPFGPVLLTEIEVTADGESVRYQLPFGLVAQPDTLALKLAIAQAPDGVLTDGFTLPAFIREVVQGMAASTRLETPDGVLQFAPGPGLAALNLGADAHVRYLSAEQSNSSVVVGAALVLKMIRRVGAGIHPELEMGSYLTDKGYPHISPLLGSVTRTDAAGDPHLLMIAQGFLNNQGDAWEWTHRKIEEAIAAETGKAPSAQGTAPALKELAGFAAKLGQRLGEMHAVLAQPSENPDFGSHITSEADTREWATSVKQQVEHALTLLGQHKDALGDADQQFVDGLLKHRASLLAQIDLLAQRAAGGLRHRVHGDLHLGQVLVVDGDAYLIDFEGEPVRPLNERRGKYSPFKDVTGVLRSIEYAAAVALRNAPESSAADSQQARQQVAERYRLESRQAFLDAYRLAAADLPHTWQERDGEGAALELFSVEKAAYEIVYEAENRPSWLAVPLQGLLSLAQKIADGDK